MRGFLPFGAYLLLQAFIVAGLPTPRYPDSAGYLALSLSGQDVRLWTVPLLYNIFTTDTLRIAAQVVLATFAWWSLANSASSLVRDRRVKIGLQAVLLALGVISPIASWNSTILSDSVAISLTALLIGCWIRFVDRSTWKNGIALVVVTLFWVFTRNDLVVIGVAITVITVIWTIRQHRTVIHIAVAIALIAISGYGLAVYGRNPFVANTNIAIAIEDRVLANPQWTNWFIAHGMPYSTAIQQTEGGTFGQALLAIPSFNEWLTARGTRTYTEFMVEHPVYTLWGPLPDFTGERASLNWPNKSPYIVTQPNPTPSMLSPSVNYGRHRSVLPTVIEDLLFEQGQIGDVLLLAFISVGAVWIARRRFGRDTRLWIPIIAALSAIPQGYLVWLTGSDGETDRHAIVLAVTLRIGLWIMLGFSLDRLISERGESSPSAIGGGFSDAGEHS